MSEEIQKIVNEALLNQSAAARLLGISGRTLERWRNQAGGPPYVRLSPRAIRYSPKALREWLEKRTTFVG